MIGVDLVHIPRFSRALSGSNGERLQERIFLPDELEQCSGKDGKALMESLAGRFAVKEAVIKASKGRLNIGDLKSIHVRKAEAGFLEADLERGGKVVEKYEVSLSHDGDYAVAIAAIVRD